MSYLSRGKRSIMEQEYAADFRVWSKAFGIRPPSCQVRIIRAGKYRTRKERIVLPPNAEKDCLVHEFAHHLDHMLYSGTGHGATFRIALVQVATIAYGRAERYPWGREYELLKRWARVHGLLKDATA